MGMCFTHPAFVCCALIFSMVYYGLIMKSWKKYFLGMLGLFLAFSLMNPLLNTYGERVLFTYWGNRPYTLEAVLYGAALASVFVTVLTWLGTYQKVFSSDKFLYCFGKVIPSISLILTMVFRLIPSLQKKTEQILGARRSIGKSVEQGNFYEKAEHGLLTVSVLTSWALEGGVVMADSMRSRGFGTGKRTSFSIFSVNTRDKVLLGWMSILFILIIYCAFGGGMQAVYTPKMHISGMENPKTLLGMICYGLFLGIPSLLHIMEEVTWHIMRSRI